MLGEQALPEVREIGRTGHAEPGDEVGGGGAAVAVDGHGRQVGLLAGCEAPEPRFEHLFHDHDLRAPHAGAGVPGLDRGGSRGGRRSPRLPAEQLHVVRVARRGPGQQLERLQLEGDTGGLGRSEQGVPRGVGGQVAELELAQAFEEGDGGAGQHVDHLGEPSTDERDRQAPPLRDQLQHARQRGQVEAAVDGVQLVDGEQDTDVAPGRGLAHLGEQPLELDAAAGLGGRPGGSGADPGDARDADAASHVLGRPLAATARERAEDLGEVELNERVGERRALPAGQRDGGPPAVPAEIGEGVEQDGLPAAPVAVVHVAERRVPRTSLERLHGLVQLLVAAGQHRRRCAPARPVGVARLCYTSHAVMLRRGCDRASEQGRCGCSSVLDAPDRGRRVVPGLRPRRRRRRSPRRRPAPGRRCAPALGAAPSAWCRDPARPARPTGLRTRRSARR